MPKHHKPDYDPPPTHRKSSSNKPVSDREASAAGRKLLLFSLAAIAIVLVGAYLLMR